MQNQLGARHVRELDSESFAIARERDLALVVALKRFERECVSRGTRRSAGKAGAQFPEGSWRKQARSGDQQQLHKRCGTEERV